MYKTKPKAEVCFRKLSSNIPLPSYLLLPLYTTYESTLWTTTRNPPICKKESKHTHTHTHTQTQTQTHTHFHTALHNEDRTWTRSEDVVEISKH